MCEIDGIDIYWKKDFKKVCENLIRYRSENNFVESSILFSDLYLIKFSHTFLKSFF